jgi:hypothetical protein
MRKSLFVLLSIAVLGAVGSPAVAQDDDGFGSNVAGTWLGTLEIPGIFPESPFITTFNADGTAQTSSNNPNSSLHHMTWMKSGPREINWRILHFTFGPNPDPLGPPEIIVGISRTSGVQEYDRRFEEYTGEFWVELCPPDPVSGGFEALLADPNDPAACFKPPIPAGSIQGKRLHVEIP